MQSAEVVQEGEFEEAAVYIVEEMEVNTTDPCKKTGRPQLSVWNSFATVIVQGKNGISKKSECKYCKMQVSSKVGRLKDHTLKCKGLRPTAAGSLEKVPEESSAMASIFTCSPKLRGVKKPAPKIRGPIGRKQSTVWDFFTTVFVQDQSGGALKQSKCNHCKTQVSSKAGRLRAHLAKCIPEAAGMTTPAASSVSITESITCTPELPQVNKHVLNRSPFLASANMNRFKTIEKFKLDKQVGKFLFATNLSFDTVQHPEFKKLASMLHPSYQPPTADLIGTTILDSVYQEIQEKFKSEVANKAVVLMQNNGNSTNHNLPVLSHLIHTGEQSFILNVTQAGANEKMDAEYSANRCLEAIDECKAKFSANVVGIVMDSSSTVESVRWIIQSAKPEMIIYGCNAHLFNLVGEKMTSKETVEQVVKVQKFFRMHHFTSSELKRLQGESPVIPEKTEWDSQIDCLKSYLKNQRLYMEIERNATSERIEIDVQVRQSIQDPHLFYDVQRLITVLEPVSSALNHLHQKATMADAVEQWLTLVNNPVYNEVQKEIISNEMKNGMTAPAIAAYMLHPSKRGKVLDPQTEEIGRQWLATKDATFVCMATYLKQGDISVFPQSFLESRVSEAMKPHLWWLGLKGWPGVSQNLIDLAMNLMICPASTISLERCFSTIGLKMTKMHNRIGIDNATKLCTISRSLKGSRETTW